MQSLLTTDADKKGAHQKPVLRATGRERTGALPLIEMTKSVLLHKNFKATIDILAPAFEVSTTRNKTTRPMGTEAKYNPPPTQGALSALRVISATTLLCGTIVALNRSDP